MCHVDPTGRSKRSMRYFRSARSSPGVGVPKLGRSPSGSAARSGTGFGFRQINKYRNKSANTTTTTTTNNDNDNDDNSNNKANTYIIITIIIIIIIIINWPRRDRPRGGAPARGWGRRPCGRWLGKTRRYT